MVHDAKRKARNRGVVEWSPLEANYRDVFGLQLEHMTLAALKKTLG